MKGKGLRVIALTDEDIVGGMIEYMLRESNSEDIKTSSNPSAGYK